MTSKINQTEKIIIFTNLNQVNDTDKNLRAISADKDVILECRRQLYDVLTYNKIFWAEAKILLIKISLI